MSTVEELGYSNLDYDEIVFPRLGIDVHVNPTAFTIFGVSIQWYGIIIVSGLLIALLFAFRNMKRIGIDPDRATDGIIGGILGALVGARAYYVLLNWDSYKGDWKAIINTREGGLAIFGGLIGAVIVGGIVCKLRKVRLLPMLDICGVGFLIGQGIGRWGNFTNQEAFGKNTDSLFCMSGGRVQRWISLNYNATFSYDKDVTLDPAYPVHPCFLYESFWCLLGAVLLFIAFKKFRKFDGQIILMYMVWYGFGRFVIEGLRTDSLMIGNLRVSQALALVICITALVLLIVQFSRVKRMGSDYVLYVNTEESKQLLAEADERLRKNKKNPPAEPVETDSQEDETTETDTDSET
ncbi:MAG TPA: prolipoprotein diacylglyceryl transferase [Ruminococcus sp.]|nr:prolipoprotein diacylglyceryl transferase [Ruminococcus sp.]